MDGWMDGVLEGGGRVDGSMLTIPPPSPSLRFVYAGNLLAHGSRGLIFGSNDT